MNVHQKLVSMAVSGCADCSRLSAIYGKATAARLGAEADFTLAAFSRSSPMLEAARRRAQSAMTEWMRANQALREHEGIHVALAHAAARVAAGRIGRPLEPATGSPGPFPHAA